MTVIDSVDLTAWRTAFDKFANLLAAVWHKIAPANHELPAGSDRRPQNFNDVYTLPTNIPFP